MKLADVLAKAKAGGYRQPVKSEPAVIRESVAMEQRKNAPMEVQNTVGQHVHGQLFAEAPPAATARLAELGVAVAYVTEPAAAVDAVAKLQQAAALGPLGLDIETAKRPPYQQHPQSGLSPFLSTPRLVQVFDGTSTAYVFDVARLGWEPLAGLWGLDMVAHNAVFELGHLRHAGLPVANLHCTLLQANALNGNRPGLAQLTQQHLGWEPDKGGQKADWGQAELSPELVGYAALDAVLAGRLFEVQAGLLEQGPRATYERMRRAQPALVNMMLAGLQFDLVAHQQLVRDWQQEALAAKGALQAVLGGGVSPDSPAQLAAWLLAHLPADVLEDWPRTKTGQLQTDADTLARVSGLAVVQPLLDYKRLQKLLTTFGTSWAQHVNPATGRVHADFKLCTRAGRLSCERPNVQQVPRGSALRALFTAPAGRVLVVADYSQVELRVAALLANERAMLAAYEQGEDLHRKTAAAVAGVPLAQVTKEQRQLAKAVNFGLLFGQGARGLAAYAASSYGVQLTEAQAAAARQAFFDTYPDLQRWQRNTARTAEATKRSITPGGRVRDFTREASGYSYTQALNTPVQGGAAEALLEALALLDERLRGLDARLVSCVHDEVLVEASAADAEAARLVLEQSMVDGFLVVFPKACTRGLVEAHVGPNWAEAKG